MYSIYHGPQGLRDIAKRLNLAANVSHKIFEHYGFTVLANKNFFDTITIIDCDA